MMTTMAALFGALPLALEGGVGAELHKPLGISIVGGLIFSQSLTLFTTRRSSMWRWTASAAASGSPAGPQVVDGVPARGVFPVGSERSGARKRFVFIRHCARVEALLMIVAAACCRRCTSVIWRLLDEVAPGVRGRGSRRSPARPAPGRASLSAGLERSWPGSGRTNRSLARGPDACGVGGLALFCGSGPQSMPLWSRTGSAGLRRRPARPAQANRCLGRQAAEDLGQWEPRDAGRAPAASASAGSTSTARASRGGCSRKAASWSCSIFSAETLEALGAYRAEYRGLARPPGRSAAELARRSGAGSPDQLEFSRASSSRQIDALDLADEAGKALGAGLLQRHRPAPRTCFELTPAALSGRAGRRGRTARSRLAFVRPAPGGRRLAGVSGSLASQGRSGERLNAAAAQELSDLAAEFDGAGAGACSSTPRQAEQIADPRARICGSI